MDYTSEQLKDIEKGDMYADERGLNIRLDSKTLAGYLKLRKFGEAIKRPINAFGGAFDNSAYMWITIPLTKIIKSHDFGNQPPARKHIKK